MINTPPVQSGFIFMSRLVNLSKSFDRLVINLNCFILTISFVQFHMVVYMCVGICDPIVATILNVAAIKSFMIYLNYYPQYCLSIYQPNMFNKYTRFVDSLGYMCVCQDYYKIHGCH